MPPLTLCGLLIAAACILTPRYSVVVHNNTKCKMETRVLMSSVSDSCAIHAATQWKKCAEQFSTAIDVQPPGRSTEGVHLFALDVKCSTGSERIYFDENCGSTTVYMQHENHEHEIHFTSKNRVRIE